MFYLSAVLEFEPKVEDAVGNFVEAGELLQVELVALDHVVSQGGVQVEHQRSPYPCRQRVQEGCQRVAPFPPEKEDTKVYFNAYRSRS